MLRLLLLLICLSTPLAAQERVLLPRADGAQTPVRHYGVEGNAPLLVLSPGLGGSENGLAALATDAQGAGYDTWVLGHAESGPALLKSVLVAPDRPAALAAAVADARANAARRADLDAVITALGPRFAAAPIRIYGGHSMGAQSVFIEAGAKNHPGVTGADRFDAYIALSFQGPGPVFPDHAWSGIAKPILTATGTRDRAVTGDWTTRLPAFEDLPARTAALLVIDGATHMDMAGGTRNDLARTSREMVVEFLRGMLLSPPQWPTPRPGASVAVK